MLSKLHAGITWGVYNSFLDLLPKADYIGSGFGLRIRISKTLQVQPRLRTIELEEMELQILVRLL